MGYADVCAKISRCETDACELLSALGKMSQRRLTCHRPLPPSSLGTPAQCHPDRLEPPSRIVPVFFRNFVFGAENTNLNKLQSVTPASKDGIRKLLRMGSR